MRAALPAAAVPDGRGGRHTLAVTPVIGLPIWARHGVFYTLIPPN